MKLIILLISAFISLVAIPFAMVDTVPQEPQLLARGHGGHHGRGGHRGGHHRGGHHRGGHRGHHRGGHRGHHGHHRGGHRGHHRGHHGHHRGGHRGYHRGGYHGYGYGGYYGGYRGYGYGGYYGGYNGSVIIPEPEVIYQPPPVIEYTPQYIPQYEPPFIQPEEPNVYPQMAPEEPPPEEQPPEETPPEEPAPPQPPTVVIKKTPKKAVPPSPSPYSYGSIPREITYAVFKSCIKKFWDDDEKDEFMQFLNMYLVSACTANTLDGYFKQHAPGRREPPKQKSSTFEIPPPS